MFGYMNEKMIETDIITSMLGKIILEPMSRGVCSGGCERAYLLRNDLRNFCMIN